MQAQLIIMEYLMYEQIERYLAGHMDATEKVAFEALMQTDARLKEQVKEHKELLKAMHHYGRRQNLRSKLNTFHYELEADNVPALEQQRPLWKIFRNRHAQTIAVAASVSLISVFGTLWSVQQLKTPVQQQTARYVELRREVDKLKKAQTAIIKDINTTVAPAPRSARFSGTGFAISSDGFIVTSSHVIEGADSIMIENKSGLKYKVTEVYRDEANDLSILKIEDPSFTGFSKLPYTFKPSESELGEKVYTLGYPREDIVFGEGSLSSSTGFEGDTSSYQVSIPLNPGNSGGPLLDEKGNLIGVISGKQAGQEGASFAIKSEYLLQMIREIPAVTTFSSINLPKTNTLSGISRPQQLKKLKEFVFVVKVYN